MGVLREAKIPLVLLNSVELINSNVLTINKNELYKVIALASQPLKAGAAGFVASREDRPEGRQGAERQLLKIAHGMPRQVRSPAQVHQDAAGLGLENGEDRRAGQTLHPHPWNGVPDGIRRTGDGGPRAFGSGDRPQFQQAAGLVVLQALRRLHQLSGQSAVGQ